MRGLIIILALFFAGTSFAGNTEGDAKKKKMVSISGKVVDNLGELVGVTIVIDNQPTVVYTDMEGNFTINNLVEGNHIIKFNMLSYEQKEVKIDADGNNPDLNIRLYSR